MLRKIKNARQCQLHEESIAEIDRDTYLTVTVPPSAAHERPGSLLTPDQDFASRLT